MCHMSGIVPILYDSACITIENVERLLDYLANVVVYLKPRCWRILLQALRCLQDPWKGWLLRDLTSPNTQYPILSSTTVTVKSCAIPLAMSSFSTNPCTLKRTGARRHSTTVETIEMAAHEHTDRMEGPRRVYQDDHGMLVEEIILQAQDPTSYLHTRYGLSERIPDEHLCEQGYVCNYTVCTVFGCLWRP